MLAQSRESSSPLYRIREPRSSSSSSLSLAFSIPESESRPSSPTSSVFSSKSSSPGTMSSQISDMAAMVEQHYFESNPPPKGLDKHTAQARDFIAEHAKTGRKVVLVSSGGTTVPLGKATSPLPRFGVPRANHPSREANSPLHRQLLRRYPRRNKRGVLPGSRL